MPPTKQVPVKLGRPFKKGNMPATYFSWAKHPSLLTNLKGLVERGADLNTIANHKDFETVPIQKISTKIHNMKKQQRLKPKMNERNISAGNFVFKF